MKGRIREVLVDVLGAILLFAFMWLVMLAGLVFPYLPLSQQAIGEARNRDQSYRLGVYQGRSYRACSMALVACGKGGDCPPYSLAQVAIVSVTIWGSVVCYTITKGLYGLTESLTSLGIVKCFLSIQQLRPLAPGLISLMLLDISAFPLMITTQCRYRLTRVPWDYKGLIRWRGVSEYISKRKISKCNQPLTQIESDTMESMQPENDLQKSGIFLKNQCNFG